MLIPAKVLTPADADLMALTCRAYAYMKRLQRECDKRKTVMYEVDGSKGQKVERRHKEFELLDLAKKKYFRLLQEFSLTPVSRNRVRRRLKEIFRRSRAIFGTSTVSVVVNARPSSSGATFEDLSADYAAAIARGLSRLPKP